jgi:hypothetical protein
MRITQGSFTLKSKAVKVAIANSIRGISHVIFSAKWITTDRSIPTKE